MGADYRPSKKGFIQLGCYDQVGPNLTRYFGPSGVSQAVEADARARIPSTCTIKRMTVYTDAPPGGADTCTVTLMMGGAATALGVIISAAERHGADNVDVVAAPYLAIYSIRVVTSATCAAIRPTVMLEVEVN